MLKYVQRFNCNSLIMSQLSSSTQLIILLALNCTFHHNFLIYSHTHHHHHNDTSTTINQRCYCGRFKLLVWKYYCGKRKCEGLFWVNLHPLHWSLIVFEVEILTLICICSVDFNKPLFQLIVVIWLMNNAILL